MNIDAHGPDGPIKAALEEKKLNASEKRMLRHLCEKESLYFNRYFFKEREGSKFIVNPHHILMSRVLDMTLTGEINRLIINIPPGYTKTEMAVVGYIARGFAINKRAKFIHTSSGESLVQLNSRLIRDTVQSPEFQQLWPMQIRKDAQSKKLWYNEWGGGLYAVPSGGQITGFRAGRIDDNKFTGAFIVDDPLKPDEAFFENARVAANRRFTNTYKSRLAEESVPIILIMQRLHEDDPTGFLLKGGSGDYWHHLVLPVEIPEDYVYPAEYTHGIPIEHDLQPGPLWERKHDASEIAILKIDEYTYASQYDQTPSPQGGSLFKDVWWKFYENMRDLTINAVAIYGDTASKTGMHNDYSVFQCIASVTHEGKRKVAIIDQIRGKWEAHDLLTTAKMFWDRHKRKFGTRQIGASSMRIEEKSSGIGLIQQLRKELQDCTVIPIDRGDKNKVMRAVAVAPEIKKGNVLLPAGPTEHTDASWVQDYRLEFQRFTPLMTHSHDDQIDPTMDAVEELLIKGMVGLYDNL